MAFWSLSVHCRRTTFHPESDCCKHVVVKNGSILDKSHPTLAVFHRKHLTPYSRALIPMNHLVWAKSTRNHATGLQPFLINPIPQASPGTHQTTIMKFFTKHHITCSTSLSDLTSSDDSQVHKSQFFLFLKDIEEMCTYKKCQICPPLNLKDTFKCITTSTKYSLKYNIT